MMLNLGLLAIFLVVFAMMLQGGIWNNLLKLVNVITAALFASNYGEPAAAWIATQMPSYTVICDFMGYWLVFCVAYVVLGILTDVVSRVRVRFKKPVDMPGGAFLGAWTAWVMVCFTTMTLHTAPLDRNFLGDFQKKPETRMLFGFAPDRLWLGYTHKQSLGGLSRSKGGDAMEEFDPTGDFIFKYSERRYRLEEQQMLRVN
jgi:hypothetical protein